MNDSLLHHQTPGIVYQPAVYRQMQKGINQIVDAIRPTLGPCARWVAIQRHSASSAPELLDSGGLIARRIIGLADRDENVGAMLLRGLLWRLHEETGDGTATAAVLFQSIFNQGVTAIAAGSGAMQLRFHLEQGMCLILDQLSNMTIPIENKELLEHVAMTVCHDAELAQMLAEIFAVIEEDGTLDIQPGRGRSLDREYVEGSYWPGGIHSREMIKDHSRMARVQNAAIFISDLEITDPHQLVPVVMAAGRKGLPSLLIMARSLSESALALLLANRDSLRLQAIAVKTPGLTTIDQAAWMQDLAVLTGGRPFLKAAGDTLSQVEPHDLGHVRRAWADSNAFGIIGGKGDPRRVREHIATLQRAVALTEEMDARNRLRQRIGKLRGGAAILRIGGVTEADIQVRVALAGRAALAMRRAVAEGALPGGGVCFLACQPALKQRLSQSREVEERAAYHILLNAMEAPIRTLMTNAGYDAGQVMAKLRNAGSGCAFDAVAGKIVDAAEARLLDVASVQKEALCSVVKAAALALTIDTVVHRKKLPIAVDPDG
jgi:chaperonin GroEL